MPLPVITLPYSFERMFDAETSSALRDLARPESGELFVPWALSVDLFGMTDDLPSRAAPDTYLVTTTQIRVLGVTDHGEVEFFLCRKMNADWRRAVGSICMTLFEDSIFSDFLSQFSKHHRTFDPDKVALTDAQIEIEFVLFPGAGAMIVNSSPIWNHGLECVSSELLTMHRFFVEESGSEHEKLRGLSNLKRFVEARLGRAPIDDDEPIQPPLAEICFARS